MKTHVRAAGRVGKISYINCLPFYHRLFENAAWDAHRYDVYESYPTKVNLAMRTGKIHIAPVSSLEYLNHQDQYEILPDLAIGSRDFSGSVLLLSKEKIENLDGEKIILSRQSLSSAAMLRILMRFKYKFKVDFVSSTASPQDMLKKSKAALVIGDEALFFESPEFVYKYDLSELWWNWTDKPFCFSLWAVRKDYVRDHRDEVRSFWRQIRDNRTRNLADIEGLLKEAMQISFMDAKFSKVYGYFFNLNYYLDEGTQDGLELFYRLANRLRIAPKPRKVDFFNPER